MGSVTRLNSSDGFVAVLHQTGLVPLFGVHLVLEGFLEKRVFTDSFPWVYSLEHCGLCRGTLRETDGPTVSCAIATPLL